MARRGAKRAPRRGGCGGGTPRALAAPPTPPSPSPPPTGVAAAGGGEDRGRDAKGPDSVVECARAMARAHRLNEQLSEWLCPLGCAAYLQRGHDEGWDELVDLGEGLGALDHLHGLDLARRINRQYARSANAMCDLAPGMPRERWGRVRFIMLGTGMAHEIAQAGAPAAR